MITYRIPADCPAEALRGLTLTDGKIAFAPNAGPRIDFPDFVSGNVVIFAGPTGEIVAPLEGKPELVESVRAHYAAEEAARVARTEAKAAALEAAVPGIAEILALADLAADEAGRYRDEFSAMMGDERNDGARPPREEDRSHAERLADLLAQNPRAALYLKAKRQDELAHWADNTGKGAAGKKAMQMLADGASVADAELALAARC